MPRRQGRHADKSDRFGVAVHSLQRRDSISQRPADERERFSQKISKNRTLASFKKATETELWSRSNLGKLPDLKR